MNDAHGDVDILIVDDRREDLLVMTEILAGMGYNLVTVTSGAEALKRILEKDFALILLDVLMPGLDGFEVAGTIKSRERSRHTPIIFLTAAGADMSFIYRGYSLGAVDYLAKPIDADVLRAKVRIFAALWLKDRQIRQQTEALRAAERLQNERRYRNLAEAIPQIVWTADASGSVTYFNHRWLAYSGRALEESLGSGWTASVHPDDLPVVTERWRGAVAAPHVLELECRLRGQDGSYRWHLCHAVPERDGGEVIGWLGTYTDFDDRRRTLDAARAAIHARDEFLTIASHELRTPLMTLQLRLQTIAEELRATETFEGTRRKIASAIRQGRRLMTLVDTLLDVSRITSGQLTLQPEELDLVEAVRDVIEQFSETARSAGCEVQLSGDARLVGEWDRVRVEQMLQNLLSNAFKYAPRSPVQVSVTSRDAPGPAGACVASIAVSDSGIGIAPENVDRVFGKFERAVPLRHYGGLGLGLFVTRQIALAHGGDVRVTSAPGEGTTFTIELPVHPDRGARPPSD